MTAALIRVRVAARQDEALDICSLDLVPVDGSALPAFSAGAHIDVHLPGGLVRQYSLCNTPGETHRYRIAVLRDAGSRGGSATVHDQLQVGTVLDIGTPRNLFELAPSAPHHLLLAGGIGITPLLAMAEQLAAQGGGFTLHHATRSRERTPFVAQLASAPYADRVHHHFDDGPAMQKLDLAATLRSAPAGSHLYVCGPTGFMEAVLAEGRAQGWDEARLHREYFAAAPTGTAGDGGFELELASSGRVIPVAADQTALAALLAAGLDIPMSCEQGVCGTCLTGVKSGVPDHRDQYLTPEERAANNQFLPCCSRASSARLVLDL
ncbi:PDR/VanB family oxidoreductase [Hydrogenophaga pseudoflava]|uniref:Phenoxybenzoate dioxygenase subunit beta n=1 Tax=Hydrogenophaga pseudoflava TaxID=47421 RepID=A0A4V1AC35_HYDPS|nr:PDR/VanB family oxidoreductase [Hydrogenophaga pseudoflava]QBM30083.1 Phenoxybenzoate dioxygenase subunit beta [Hydrogenophaga pseudoflava]